MASIENFDDEDFCEICGDDDPCYCERCGGIIGNDGECEICGDSYQWTWFLPNDSDKIECTNCETDIYKTRRYCFFCGEKNELAFKKGSIYCPKCGNAVENGICPNCGKKQNNILVRTIKPEDKRYCPVCGEEISVNDYFCFNCGNENYINKPLKDKPVTQQQEKPEEIIIPRRIGINDYLCPECGGTFDMDGFCWKCAVDRVKVSVRKLKLEEARHCPFCGEIISVKDKFCTYCGEKTHREKPEPKPKTQTVSKTEPAEKVPLKSEDRSRYNQNNREAVTRSVSKDYLYESDLNTTLWLVLGIISLILCCTPTSIGTIICSIGAKNAETDGNIRLARRKIIAAKIWLFAGIAIIALFMIASVIIQVTKNIQ